MDTAIKVTIWLSAFYSIVHGQALLQGKTPLEMFGIEQQTKAPSNTKFKNQPTKQNQPVTPLKNDL